MDKDVITEDTIHRNISNMKHRENVASNDYTQFKLLLGMMPIDDYYNETTINDIKPHISIRDKGSLKLTVKLVEYLMQKLS